MSMSQDESDEDDNRFETLSSLEKLKYLRRNVNWEDEDEREHFLSQLYPLIADWKGQLPHLRDIFRPEEIDWLLTEAVLSNDTSQTYSLIDFVIDSGYKDEPVFDKDGKPLLRRTTPLHQVVKVDLSRLFPRLLTIYQRADANYTDESGLSHFHVACMNGFDDVVKRFLELGQDPNCLSEEADTTSSVDPPLHLALTWDNSGTAELLLRSGADPNAATADGRTLLHVLQDEELAEELFEICNEIEKPVQVDARNKAGDTPLHVALRSVNENFMELLLRRGADPNIVDAKGSTPLHIIAVNHCYHNDGLAGRFFKIVDEQHLTVQIDAQDNLGRTPLQLAVSNVQPCVVDVLLDRGADLSSFVFPAKSHFDEGVKPQVDRIPLDFKVKLAAGLLFVIERLENKGYNLDRSDAMIIMELFSKYELFEKSSVIDKRWYDDEEFATTAKECTINSSLSLYDVIQLRPEEMKKQVTYMEYFKFARENRLWNLPKSLAETCAVHLCEIMSRGFFRKWALDCFSELIRHRLSIECCEMIIKNLKNEDLYHIYCAAASPSS